MGIQPCLAGGHAGEETALFLNAQVHMVFICAQSVAIVILEIKLTHKSKLNVYMKECTFLDAVILIISCCKMTMFFYLTGTKQDETILKCLKCATVRINEMKWKITKINKGKVVFVSCVWRLERITRLVI